ncbi:MAG: class I SAM-dependent methyltransferase [Gaiellaceae bacterium]
MSLNDPDVVRAEYASEHGLAGRKAAYRYATGPDPRELAFEAVREAAPGRVLEVGCGEGELAERVARELGCAVVALDQSARMVELTQARGVDARLGDVQELPFADGSFDCAVAAWMLYHVPDVDRALAQLARVLCSGGRLVAVTNSAGHLRELRELLDVEPIPSAFSAENGEAQLAANFARVERRDAYGSIDFPDRAGAQAYVDATSGLKWEGRRLPSFDGPLRVSRAPVVFVAEKE